MARADMREESKVIYKDSNGRSYTMGQLQPTLNKVADDMVNNAHSIRNNDPYASHVATETKVIDFNDSLERAEQVRNGAHLNNFTIWQRVNAYLTGDCVAFLP